MALVSIGPTHWPTQPINVLPSFANLTIDAADEVAAFVFRVWRAGTVTRLHFRTGTVTTGATVDVRLETVGADGLGTGTLFGTNTNVAHVIADANDNVWHRTAALTGSATVAVGDLVAVVIVNPTVSAGNLIISAGTNTALYGGVAPYSLSPTRATKSVSAPICALEYDDGVLRGPLACIPMHTTTTNLTLNTGTNPDEAAAYLTLPFPCRVIGWWGNIAVAAGADYRVSLYEDGNTTPLLTKDYDGDQVAAAGIGGQEQPFGSALELDAGIYRLGLVPLTANSLTARYWEVSSAHPTLLDTISGGADCHYSSRNRSGTTDPDAAAWAQTANRRMMLGLLIDQIDDGAGAGGGLADSVFGGAVVR